MLSVTLVSLPYTSLLTLASSRLCTGCRYHLLVGKLEGPGVHPEDASPLTHVLAGGTSGCLAWCSIYSLDVVKSRWVRCTRCVYHGHTLAAALPAVLMCIIVKV
jgi:hypothetical protein